jgi:DNA repair ATPase RecN
MVKLIDGGEFVKLQEENNRLYLENKALSLKLQAAEKEIARLNGDSTIHWRQIDLARIKELEGRLDAEMKRTAEAMSLVKDRTDRGDSWREMADELEERLKASEGRLDAYQKLTRDMREWHAIMAYSDFEKHESAWDALILRAAELERSP